MARKKHKYWKMGVRFSREGQYLVGASGVGYLFNLEYVTGRECCFTIEQHYKITFKRTVDGRIVWAGDCDSLPQEQYWLLRSHAEMLMAAVFKGYQRKAKTQKPTGPLLAQQSFLFV